VRPETLGNHRKRRCQLQGSADRLQRARRVEREKIGRRPAQERGEGEDRQAEDQHAAAS
jgi:hypothetical protein